MHHTSFQRVAPSVDSLATSAMAKMRQNWKWRKPFNRRDRKLEKARFEALLRSLPSPSINVYTDGSSFGNPGPAGAGYVVEDPTGDYVIHYSRHLGEASNNSAEIEALLGALLK